MYENGRKVIMTPNAGFVVATVFFYHFNMVSVTFSLRLISVNQLLCNNQTLDSEILGENIVTCLTTQKELNQGGNPVWGPVHWSLLDHSLNLLFYGYQETINIHYKNCVLYMYYQ